MAKKNQPAPKSFEDELAELEKILGEIEGGEIGLEDSLIKYERGNFLIQHCRTILNRAEKQIEQLSKGDEPAGAPDEDPAEEQEVASATEILSKHGEALGQYLRSWLQTHSQAPPLLLEAIEYSVMAGGKRLRPALVIESFIACGGKQTNASTALAAASAVELVHTFSLVHDDLPAMDDDDLRRGRATNHKVFGEAMAILAGDAMVTMAFELLAREAPPLLAAALVRELATAAGPAGMIGGQVLDMAAENQTLDLSQLQRIHRMKTGALLTASCVMGAIAADASDAHRAALANYGRHLGLTFQIVDDLLDATATTQQLGKETRKDVARGKSTYPALLGVDATRAAAHEQLAAALAALAALEPFGAGGESLREIARFVVSRAE